MGIPEGIKVKILLINEILNKECMTEGEVNERRTLLQYAKFSLDDGFRSLKEHVFQTHIFSVFLPPNCTFRPMTGLLDARVNLRGTFDVTG